MAVIVTPASRGDFAQGQEGSTSGEAKLARPPGAPAAP